MPTPIEWADEHERMENIRVHRGCPHGRLGPCSVCDQLEREAQEVMENEGGTYFATSGENAGHWTEGPPPPQPFEDADQDRYDNPDPVESGETPEGGEFIETYDGDVVVAYDDPISDARQPEDGPAPSRWPR